MRHLLEAVVLLAVVVGLATVLSFALDKEFADQPLHVNIEIPAR